MDCSRIGSYICIHIHDFVASKKSSSTCYQVRYFVCIVLGTLLHYSARSTHLLVPEVETEPFVFTDSEDIEEELYSVNSDGTMITHKAIWRDTFENHTFEVSKRSQNTSLEWGPIELDSFPGSPDIFSVTEGEYGYTINNDLWIWTLNKETGEVMSKYSCFDVEAWDGTQNLTFNKEDATCVSTLETVDNPNADVVKQGDHCTF